MNAVIRVSAKTNTRSKKISNVVAWCVSSTMTGPDRKSRLMALSSSTPGPAAAEVVSAAAIPDSGGGCGEFRCPGRFGYRRVGRPVAADQQEHRQRRGRQQYRADRERHVVPV